jgi:adenylate kinase
VRYPDRGDPDVRLIMMGPPGAGKGTQGALLARRLGIPRYSTGDILRQALRDGTAMGLEARRNMHSGELVPDDVILGIVGEALDSEESSRGFLLDGFPRTVAQAEGLRALLLEMGQELDAIVDLSVDDDEIMRRLSTRGRKDDLQETIRRRLEVYRAKKKPLLDWYEDTGVRIVSVEGVGDIDEIQAQILGCLTQ